MTAKEIFKELEKENRTLVLCEHSIADNMIQLSRDRISQLRGQLVRLMPEARREEGAVALDGDLERLYLHCRRQYDRGG